MKKLLELYKKVYPNSDGADFHNFIRNFHMQILPITERDKKYQEQREQAARMFLEQRL